AASLPNLSRAPGESIAQLGGAGDLLLENCNAAYPGFGHGRINLAGAQLHHEPTSQSMQRAEAAPSTERKCSPPLERTGCLEIAGGVAGGDEAEGHAGSDGDSGAGISARHDRGHVVAAGVEASDRRGIVPQHPRELV